MNPSVCSRLIGAAAALVVTLAAPAEVHSADAESPPADTQLPKSAAPPLSDVLKASGIDLHGYIDAAYSRLSGAGVFTSGVADRVFDTEADSFNVHQAAVIVSYLPKEGFGGLVNLTAGRDARIIASAGESTSNFDVTQAFVQYAHGPLTIMSGKYVTLAGAEVINSTADTNYSRSILFGYAIPFAHTGVRVTYAASDQVSLIVGINNGWDQLQDTNKQKTLEAGLSFTPNKTFSLAVQGYSGIEQGTTASTLGGGGSSGVPFGTHGRRDLIDAVGTWNVSGQLTLILNVDWADQENGYARPDGTLGSAQWLGAAGYANYQFNDQWAVSARAEVFDDKQGFRTGVVNGSGGLGQTWSEGTLTLRYLPNTNFEVRTEARWDHSNGRNFVDDALSFVASGGSTGSKADQWSFGVEGIAKF